MQVDTGMNEDTGHGGFATASNQKDITTVVQRVIIAGMSKRTGKRVGSRQAESCP